MSELSDVAIEALKETLQQSREGLPVGETVNGHRLALRASPHEAKLYSICEGLIVEVERLREQNAKLLEMFTHHGHPWRVK